MLAIAAVTTVGCLGSLAGPPLVGVLSVPLGLRLLRRVPAVLLAVGVVILSLGGQRRS